MRSPTSQGQSLHGKNILVIDDEIHITELIYHVLVREGASIDLANSGADAFNQIKTKDYDVIICDQRMPGISGQRLYRVLESSNPEMRHKFLFCHWGRREFTDEAFLRAGRRSVHSKAVQDSGAVGSD
jgi:CheY-like chemotaxis protein